MIATAAGVQSNLELTLPLVVIGVLFVWLWGDLARFLTSRLDEASELLDDPQDGPPLRATTERARRERTAGRALDDGRVRGSRCALSPHKEMEF